MRILFYTNWYLRQTLPVANALAAEHQVELILPRTEKTGGFNDGCLGEAQLRQILAPNITLNTLPHMQGLDPWGIITVLRSRQIIRQFQPDIVHFNESYDFRCLLLMLLCPQVRYVTSVHDPVPHSDEKISLHKFKHWVRDQIRRKSSALIVYGESLRAVLAEYSGIEMDRIHAVPHGEYRYYSYFTPDPGLQQQDGCRRVLFFGRWSHYKGIDLLVKAEPLITRRVPAARFVLAGEGPLQLADLQAQMRHPENFEIYNYSIPDEQVAEFYQQAEIVVLPYRQATQSGPLHIAGTFGKPAIVTRVGAMPEVIQEGETGLLIPPEDPEALAQAVCRLLEDPSEARRMGENARRRMTQNESSEMVANMQAEVYRQALSAPGITRRKRSISLLQWLVKKVKREAHYAFDPALKFSDVLALFWKLGTSLARGTFYRPWLAGSKGLCFINGRVKLRNCRHIHVGRNFVAESGCEIQGLSRSGVRFGDNVTVGSFAMIRPSGYYGREIGEGLEVGNNSNIGPYCYLGAYGGITIGADVMMGPRVSLFAENHDFERTDMAMRRQGVTRKRITIEDDCWLASGAIILAGVTIGRGSIVAAGSVVTRNIPSFSIVAGNPARVLRSRKKMPQPAEEEA